MSLRDRQIGGIPLTWWNAFFLNWLNVGVVILMSLKVWSPFFGIPEELRGVVASVGVGFYLYNTTGRVLPGKERAQLFFGMYTGISFPAGIYFLPKIPFPIISFLLELVFKDEVSKYLGWVLEGDVDVKSIVTSFFAEGLTSDGIRVSLHGRLVFEVMNAAVFLSQQISGDNKTDIEDALQAEVANQLKQRIIARCTAKNLYQGNYQGGIALNEWVTEACDFVRDFGLRLARSPVVTVKIESERIQKAFDADGAQELLTRTTGALGERFRRFKENLGPDVSEEVALMLFNADQIDNGQPTLNMNNIKFK